MVNSIKEKQTAELILKLSGMVEDAKVVVGSSEAEKIICHIVFDMYEYFFDDQDKNNEQFTKETKLYISMLDMNENSYKNNFNSDLITQRYLGFKKLSDVEKEDDFKKCSINNFLLDNAIAVNVAWHHILKKLNAVRKNSEEGPNKKIEYLFARRVSHYWTTASEKKRDWSYKAAEKGLEQYRAYIFRDAGFIFKHKLPISEESKQALVELIKRTLEEKKQYVLDQKLKITTKIQNFRSNMLKKINASTGQNNVDNTKPKASLISLMSTIFSSGALYRQEVQVAEALGYVTNENQQEMNVCSMVDNSLQLKFACELRFINLLAVFLTLVNDIQPHQEFPLRCMTETIQEIMQLTHAYKFSCSMQEANSFSYSLEQELQSIIQPFKILFDLQKVLTHLSVSNENTSEIVAPEAKRIKLEK